MMDAIMGAVGGVRAAIDAVRGINSKLTAVEIAEVKQVLLERLGEAQIALGDARENLQTARDQLRTLEAEVVRLKDWSAEAENYALADTGRGAVAYLPKGVEPSPKSGAWLCPHCFADFKKSHLIPEDRGPYWVLRCHPCKFEIITNGRKLDQKGR